MTAVKLSDRDFLEDYLCFGIWQPAIFSTWLMNQLSEKGGFNKAAALQIYVNFEMALEMLAMWYFALTEWQPGQSSLARSFTKIDISGRPDHPYNVEASLAKIAAMEPDDLLVALKQPTSDDLRKRGWGDEELRGREEVAKQIPELVKRALANRTGTNIDLVQAYNKFKHGLFVFQELRGEGADGVALIQKVISDGPNGVMVQPIWLSHEREHLKAIGDITVTVCQLAACLLATLPWFYFTKDNWQTYRKSPNATGSMIYVWQKIMEMRAGPAG